MTTTRVAIRVTPNGSADDETPLMANPFLRGQDLWFTIGRGQKTDQGSGVQGDLLKRWRGWRLDYTSQWWSAVRTDIRNALNRYRMGWEA